MRPGALGDADGRADAEEPMSWIEDIEAMAPGDPCEFRYPARSEWLPGTIVKNGGYGYWEVRNADGQVKYGLYAEQIRAPGGPDCDSA